MTASTPASAAAACPCNGARCPTPTTPLPGRAPAPVSSPPRSDADRAGLHAARRRPSRISPEQRRQYAGRLLGVAAGDVEGGSAAAPAAGRRRRLAPPSRPRPPPAPAHRVRRPPRCWSPRGSGRPRRPRRSASRARDPRPTARRGGPRRAVRPRPAPRPDASRPPSACGARGPPRSARRVPTNSEPIGAPSPFERHTARASVAAAYSASGVPVATCAFQIRAPSMCTEIPTVSAQTRRACRSASGRMVPPAKLCVFSIATAVVRTKNGPMSGAYISCTAARSSRPRGCDPGAAGQAGQGAVRAELGAQDVRPRLAQHLLAGADQRGQSEHVGHRARGGEQRRLLAEELGHPVLEPAYGRVLVVHVVADLGVGHGATHPRRRPGQRVGA